MAMKLPRLPHRWNVTARQAIAIQKRLAGRVIMDGPGKPVRTVAGIDAAFTNDAQSCIAGVVVWDVVSTSVIEESWALRPLRFPYVPGLLTFREAPAILAALRKLRSAPDALMCDGHGFAHPRRFGIACHVGFVAGMPSVGCGKSRLVGKDAEPARRRGSSVPLTDRGEVIGSVLRTQDGVRPVYASIGHLFSLENAEALILACSTHYRLPEPTRLADQLVARIKRTVR
jgi:deoxyribonuclease V